MAGLRTQQLNALQTTGEENIDFLVYDKDGNKLSNETKNVLITAPGVLRPINENLSVEYLRPLKEAIKTTEIVDYKLLNKNPNFRYSTFNWSFGSGVSLIQPNQIFGDIVPVSGLYCLHQQLPKQGDDKTNHLIKTILAQTIALNEQDIEIGYEYYVRSSKRNEPVRSRFFLSVGADTTGNGSVNLMYDFQENKFSTGTFTDDKFFKIVDVSTYNKWVKYRTSLQNVNFESFSSAKLEVKLFPLAFADQDQFINSISNTFVDAFYIGQKKDFKKIIHTKTNGLNTELLDIAPINNLTGEYKLPNAFLTNEIDDFDTNNINGEYGRKDRIDYLNNTLDKIVLQEIINDYRSPIKKYEGEFYRDDAVEIPIYFYNKIWVNFGTDVLQDRASCMIDSLEFDVKANIYKVNMHIPNIGSFVSELLDDAVSYDRFKFE